MGNGRYCFSIKFCLAPSAPRDPIITIIDETRLQLQWMEPEVLNGIIRMYRVSLTFIMSLLKSTQLLNITYDLIYIKPGSLRPGADAPSFLKSVSVRLSVCLCVHPQGYYLITSGMMWCDIDPI